MEGLASWLVRLEDEVRDEEHLPSGSIHKLPESVINGMAEDYKPRFISIGPYYHGEPDLEAMEKHKKRAVVQFFRRSERSIGECWGELEKVVGDLKLAYTSLDPKWQENTEPFLQLMIQDGCFILEFLGQLGRHWAREKMEDDYGPNDPIFGRHGMIYNERSMAHDMFLLQNQLPLQVLRLLLAVYYGYEDMEDPMIDELIGRHTHGIYLLLREWTSFEYHLLDVSRKNLVGKASAGEAQVASTLALSPDLSERIWSAREMYEAGIRIESSRTIELASISFDRGILKLPVNQVQDQTKTFLLNLMAFEHFQPEIGYEVTGYVSLMASIIHNAEDVSFLSSRNIILKDPTAITDEDVAQLFKLLSKDIKLWRYKTGS